MSRVRFHLLTPPLTSPVSAHDLSELIAYPLLMSNLIILTSLMTIPHFLDDLNQGLKLFNPSKLLWILPTSKHPRILRSFRFQHFLSSSHLSYHLRGGLIELLIFFSFLVNLSNLILLFLQSRSSLGCCSSAKHIHDFISQTHSITLSLLLRLVLKR
jgi:hypothetical protein